MAEIAGQSFSLHGSQEGGRKGDRGRQRGRGWRERGGMGRIGGREKRRFPGRRERERKMERGGENFKGRT